MSVMSYGELDGLVIRLFNKTTVNRGFYTAAKVADAIQEAMTYIASRAFVIGQGWASKLDDVDTVAGQRTLAIPPHWAMIKKIMYRVGDQFEPLVYDDNDKTPESTADSGATQWPGTYRIVDNKIYFSPVLAEGGTGYMRVEYMTYPKVPQNDIDQMDFHVNDTWKEFIKYHAAKVLYSNFEKGLFNMQSNYDQWHETVIAMLSKRNLGATYIRDAFP
jgi:hypothetical protein